MLSFIKPKVSPRVFIFSSIIPEYFPPSPATCSMIFSKSLNFNPVTSTSSANSFCPVSNSVISAITSRTFIPLLPNEYIASLSNLLVAFTLLKTVTNSSSGALVLAAISDSLLSVGITSSTSVL